MPAMSRKQCLSFLAEDTRTAKLATVRRDGRPHVAPVWFELDGDGLVFTTGKKSVKGQTMSRDRRVAVCVDDERFPCAMVVVEGEAAVSADPDALLEWATRIAVRYVGPEQAEAFGRRNSGPGELLVRVPMQGVLAYDRMAG
jgi:PPOX class probable F420-dependent enzyme